MIQALAGYSKIIHDTVEAHEKRTGVSYEDMFKPSAMKHYNARNTLVNNLDIAGVGFYDICNISGFEEKRVRSVLHYRDFAIRGSLERVA